MILGIGVATMKPPSLEYPGDIAGWLEKMSPKGRDSVQMKIRNNLPHDNLGIVGSYDWIYRRMGYVDVIMFIHDDVICREDRWDERVMAEFEDPEVGLVGFGGALWHGTPDLYKIPYLLQNLRRGNYRSNVDDAEVHGDRFERACDVAVLDGFSLIVRRSLLDRMGGMARLKCDFFGYDYSLCAYARRFGYRVRVVGIRCHHRGGQTSLAASEITSQEAYDRSHRWFYDEFRDVMPYDVRQ